MILKLCSFEHYNVSYLFLSVKSATSSRNQGNIIKSLLMLYVIMKQNKNGTE